VQKAGHLKEEYQWIEKAIPVPLSDSGHEAFTRADGKKIARRREGQISLKIKVIPRTGLETSNG
jgi:hypothetical protein